jgi:hypothetical protein
MPNLYFAIKARRKILDALRRTPEYQERQRIFLEANSWCEVWLEVGIKVPSTLIHHVYRWSYKSPAIYMDFFNNGAEAVSFKGHYARHHGLKVCPECKKKMCPHEATSCKACFEKKHPEIVKLQKELEDKKKEDLKASRKIKSINKLRNKHMCRYWGRGQKCKLRSVACQHSHTDAPKCKWYKEKVKK